MEQKIASTPYRTFGDRAAREYRAKLEEMEGRAEAARARADEASVRSYENLASGWREMIKHAERLRPADGRRSVGSSYEAASSLD